MRRKRNGSTLKFITILALSAVVIGIIYYLATSKMFERNKPEISISNTLYWNLTSPLPLSITDDNGIKSVKVALSDGQRTITLMDENFNIIKPSLNLEINFPKGAILDKNSNFELIVEATDISRWNFFFGNTNKIVSKIIVDTKRPDVYILNQSYKITKGGSAVVVFRAKDDMMKEVFIETNYGKKFKATPFIKENYYASLVAWPANLEEFSAYVVAKDMARNETKTRIKYYVQDKKYKVSNIALNQNFIDGKITDLTNQYAQNPDSIEGLQKFKFVNETLRNSNEKLIQNITSNVYETMLTEFFINPFYPLKKAAAVASFGDHRFYTWDGKNVSESWHLGLDLASVANAEIKQSNPGRVVLVQENGIYGLNIGIYHGFGLYAIYAHCSNSNVKVGDNVKTGDTIGNTGASGLAFGDHLHFGILVQGIEVRPEEWMDGKWMKENIYSILDNAKKVIESEK